MDIHEYQKNHDAELLELGVSKTTMDIYAKVKYNKPEELSSVVNAAFGLR